MTLHFREAQADNPDNHNG